jgi:hypothetical protein
VPTHEILSSFGHRVCRPHALVNRFAKNPDARWPFPLDQRARDGSVSGSIVGIYHRTPELTGKNNGFVARARNNTAMIGLKDSTGLANSPREDSLSLRLTNQALKARARVRGNLSHLEVA